MGEAGKAIFVIGLVVAGIGLFMWSGIGRGWFGQLPGDINYQRGGFRFHFPLVTCLVISIVLTFLLWLFRR